MRALSACGACATVLIVAGAGTLHAASTPAMKTIAAHTNSGTSAAALRPIAIAQVETDHVVDVGALGIRPAAKPLPMSHRPLGTVVGVGNATVAAAPEIAQPSTTAAIGTIAGNFIPAESVQYYLNGSLAGTFAANADGVVAVGLNTGAGAGYLTVEELGVTSTRHAGVVVQVAAAGPYPPGLSVMPHAVNTTASGKIYLYGFRYPISSTVNLYRDAVSLGTAATNASGRYFVSITPANNGDTSAIYSSDTGAAGLFAGRSVEERSDAGTPPLGDQNLARSFFDREVLTAAGGAIAWTGEGFQPGESVTVSGCAGATLTANGFGTVGAFLAFGASSGTAQCVLTGGTSGRVARGTVQMNANVTDVPAMIVQGQNVAGMAPGTTAVLFSRLTPNDTGTIYIDGIAQGATSTNASGYSSVAITTPATGFLHAVTYAGTTQSVSAPLIVPVELSRFAAE
jgi:hypothetical protein